MNFKSYIRRMECIICKQEKAEHDFSWRNEARKVKHKKCKQCVSQLVKKHYLANKGKYKEKAKSNNGAYQDRNRRFIFDFLSKNPCVDCGESDVVVLDFDHVSGRKTASISRMKLQSHSLKTLSNEISKCEVRCANCHRRKTAKENKHFVSLMQSGEIE